MADRLKARELGANDFITKPISNSDLIARIARQLPGSETPAGSGP